MSRNATDAPAAESRASGSASHVEIRHVRTHDEFVKCVKLQGATWGAAFSESVPATILKITQRLGGVTAGAFDPDGTLLGFIFGVTGIEDGALVHWSDMLAVDARAQNQGIGRRLKEFQREAVLAVGVTRMYWTYDPLVARNAHFNLNRLGARVREYVPDMYGADTGSALHSGLGTDRFIVVWPITPAAVTEDAAAIARAEAAPSLAGWRASPILNAGTVEGTITDLTSFNGVPPPLARVEIPADIFRVQSVHVAQAIRWRQSTRRAFQWALANSYSIERFEHDPSGDVGHYVLARTAPPTNTSH